MTRILRALVVIVMLQGPGAALRAYAQVPPHIPGTICFTPQFWCWAPSPGASGYPCSCPTPYGWVGGRLG